ncbi:DUF1489 family protein [Camelimonas abortus]|uniref:DUF1489 family protein n=1 Tax=Camelimonas abortus TaxID=1017184 RepID=A0ABV7LEW0_9HYPH
MPLNLIKLCVGCDSIDDLRAWIAQNERMARASGADRRPYATTRMMPKRRDELAGGSLYWVIRGHIACRQRIAGFEPFTDGEGVGRVRVMLEPEVIPVRPRRHRAFQGWRYLEDRDAPEDMAAAAETGDMPEEMKRELAGLGLL